MCLFSVKSVCLGLICVLDVLRFMGLYIEGDFRFFFWCRLCGDVAVCRVLGQCMSDAYTAHHHHQHHHLTC